MHCDVFRITPMPRVGNESACLPKLSSGSAAKKATAPFPSKRCAKRSVSSRDSCVMACANGGISSLPVSPHGGWRGVHRSYEVGGSAHPPDAANGSRNLLEACQLLDRLPVF